MTIMPTTVLRSGLIAARHVPPSKVDVSSHALFPGRSNSSRRHD